MSKVEEVDLLFKKGLNCAQALAAVYGDELGIDNDTALRIANAFGGGMGKTGETCGAVTGALMVIGLKHGSADINDKSSKAKTYELTRKFLDKFSARNSSITCRDLLGFDLSSDNIDPDSGKIIAEKCQKFVRDAAEIIEEIIQPRTDTE